MMRQQRGAALILVLVGLTVLLFMALALIRSTDTATAITGNMASRQAAAHAADTAFARASANITELSNPDTAIPGRYSPVGLATTAAGLPQQDWTLIPTTAVGNYQVQYFIERLCRVTPVSSAQNDCATATPAADSSSRKVGSALYLPLVAVYYRVTARIRGPHHSEAYLQVLFTK